MKNGDLMQYKYKKEEGEIHKFKAIEKMQSTIQKKRGWLETFIVAVLVVFANIMIIVSPSSFFSHFSILWQIIIAFFIAHTVMALIELILDSEFLYSYICRHMDCPIKVRYIDVVNNNDAQSKLPGFVMEFDVKTSVDYKMAVTLLIDDKSYFVMGLVDCSKVLYNVKMTFSPEEVENAVKSTEEKCIQDKKFITVTIMKCLSEEAEEGQMGDSSLFDTSFKINEYIYLPLFESKTEESSPSKNNTAANK